MREQLRPYLNKRAQFIATVGGFRQLHYREHTRTLVLLKNVRRPSDGVELCDHVHVGYGKELQALGLKEGDIIRFEARAKEYTAGYRGHRYDDDQYAEVSPVREDIKLAWVREVKIIGKAESPLEPSPEPLKVYVGPATSAATRVRGPLDKFFEVEGS